MSAAFNRRQFLNQIVAVGAATPFAVAAAPQRTAEPMDKDESGRRK